MPDLATTVQAASSLMLVAAALWVLWMEYRRWIHGEVGR